MPCHIYCHMLSLRRQGARTVILFSSIIILMLGAVFSPLFGAEARSIAVFATEKVMGQRVVSYFNAFGTPASMRNECEDSLSREINDGGFAVAGGSYSEKQKIEAKKLHAVFERYTDVSAMPNDMAVKAANIVDSGVVAVVACVVSSGNNKRETNAGSVCATGSCKAVDMKTKKRVATATGRSCIDKSDALLPLPSASVRAVCEDVGRQIAVKLGGRY